MFLQKLLLKDLTVVLMVSCKAETVVINQLQYSSYLHGWLPHLYFQDTFNSGERVQDVINNSWTILYKFVIF